jgi:amino acid adenylation domain-containing protein
MENTNNKIAVVGMACRYPGANNLNEYWNNLISGRDTIKHFSDDELRGFEPDFENLMKNPDYVRARGILNGIDMFDAPFFGMTPKEAAETDPQHRVWLETVWDAFENAGCDPVTYKGAIGVYAGCSASTYLLNNILRDPRKLENYIRLRSSASYQIMTSNDPSFIATKTAYKLNLKGPAINVQTACSTSLVAIIQACQSLFSYESDMCLAGGVCISVPQECGYIYQEGAIPSPDGICRPFDAMAKGTVGSSGVGAVVLKRLEDAINDGDTIYAVVRGWALNNDGSSKVSYTAPSIDGQAEVIMMAQSFAEVSPEEIGYVEAHGTATSLGDPVEVAALTRAFSSRTSKKQFCGIGSVKSNIGHTDTAAGVAAFIKTCLAAYNKKIPASLHYSKPNPHIDFANSPFYVQSELKEWNQEKPLIMGVSSFGIGGTNSHVIVEEPPVRKHQENAKSEWPQIILLSARSENSLNERKKNLVKFADENPELNIRDVAWTLLTGRNHMLHRSYMVVSDRKEILSGVDGFVDGHASDLSTGITFMFPGQGAQYISMGKNLYDTNSQFRRILDECFEIIKSETGENLKALLFESNDVENADKRLESTEMAQPALFIIEYAIAEVLLQLGIKPDCLIGHSIGEYAAACLAGVFDMQTALKIVIRRGSLMKSMPGGKMFAVVSGIENLKNINDSLFEIGADNASSMCSISFKETNKQKVIEILEKNGIKYIPLNTSHAFHSADFEPILDEFEKYVGGFTLKSPRLPFISCLTGEFITPEQATSGRYWAQQLRNTVCFRKGIQTIAAQRDTIFIEVGPNTHLGSLVRQNKEVANKKVVISTLGKADNTDDKRKIIAVIGQLFINGLRPAPETLYKDQNPSKVVLPLYPFDKKHHWVDYKLPETGYTQTDIVSDSQRRDNEPDTASSANISESEVTTGGTNVNILNIWRGILGDEIGPNDDFFELGGHSLLALQIITRIKEELNQRLTLKDFLDNPTVNKISRFLGEHEVVAFTSKEPVQKIDTSNIPLSDSQRRIWILAQMDKENPAYNISFTYKLAGNLNVDVFSKSLNLLFERHFIMFSTFREKDGEPYCEIVPKPVLLDTNDFSALPLKESEEKIYAFACKDSRKPFYIETDPLYRLFLLKQDNSTYYFHATLHHLVFDGWSWSIFARDLKLIYESLLTGEKLELEDVKDHYFDYFHWLKGYDDKEQKEKLKDFWVENLKGCSPELKFPYDRQRNNVPSGLGKKETITIPSDITCKLKDISKKKNATVFATVLPALGVLFNKYSGDNDICIGTHVANRAHSGLEDIFGMFVNTIPVRLKIDDSQKFSDFITYSKDALLDAISNQDLPFESIVEAVNPSRSSFINPLFQVSIVWLYDSALPLELGDVKGEIMTLEEGISPFDITLYLREGTDVITGEIEFNEDILDRDTIIGLKDNFIHLLESITKQPDQAISDFSLVSERDLKKLTEFNNTEAPVPDFLVHELFEKQASLNPSKPAVYFKESMLTYRELDERANQLAGYLISLGVKKGDFVGICIERSIEMVVSLLGVLKAGGCYLPLDPSFPQDRLNYMVEDSAAKVIISQSTLVDKAGSFSASSVIFIDKQKATIAAFPSYKPVIEQDTDPQIYIIYTSGSTGKPKGVPVRHRSVVNMINSMTVAPGISDTDRVLAVVTLSFDMSVYELFIALLNGASIVIAGSNDVTNGLALIDLIDKHDITVIQATPSFWNILISCGWKGKKNLKALCGGEALVPGLVRQMLPRVSEFWNCYGPTETTVYSTCTQVTDPDGLIHIGKPLNNTKIYILDKNNVVLPVGAVGEVAIGGIGLSKGYRNKPDLTFEKFIISKSGEIIYKTGDIGHFLKDGNVELFGRADNQIKLRGFRIEPGEIENLLTRLPNITEAVVKLHRFEDNDDRLVAFIVVDSTFKMSREEIVDSLSHHLPQYMIPSFFQMYSEFPRLPNGKVNKTALVFNEKEQLSKAEVKKETLTPTEAIIFDIWSKQLKTNEISVQDNFFSIGGNSLMAISIFSKIQSVLNVSLNLRIFFDSPRIKDIAEFIDMTKRKSSQNVQDNGDDKQKPNIVKGEI